jgi:geranylgeranyl diphosphate synthase type II
VRRRQCPLKRLKVEIKSYLNKQKNIVEDALLNYIPKPAAPFKHHIESLRYSLFAGGKRIRPILCLAAAESIDVEKETISSLLPIACALECIHTYSLIHDDLPAMDNDELRRGKPTNHILYGEANAILAGDGLLTLAFELITDQCNGRLKPEQRLKIANIISIASGSFGMVGGQSLDIAHENKKFPFEMLQTIHRSKTGALITAAVHAGAIGASADEKETDALLRYGDQIGLAFQIVDDLLNVTATTEQLGKSAGSDEENGKATYPAYFGIEDTRKKAQQATSNAKDALISLGSRAEPLRALADYVFMRSH